MKNTKKEKSIAQVQKYNRVRNSILMKNLAIAGSIGTDSMKTNIPTTAREAHDEIGGVSKAQFAWSLKKGHEFGFFTRYYDKKARCFKYILNNERIIK